MTLENKQILINRLKSFAWRAGMMVVALGVDFAIQNLGLLNLPNEITVVSGLILGEVSKYLNTRSK